MAVEFRPAPRLSYARQSEARREGESLPTGKLSGVGWEAVQEGDERAVWYVYHDGEKRGALEAPVYNNRNWYSCTYDGDRTAHEFPPLFISKEFAASAIVEWFEKQ